MPAHKLQSCYESVTKLLESRKIKDSLASAASPLPSIKEAALPHFVDSFMNGCGEVGEAQGIPSWVQLRSNFATTSSNLARQEVQVQPERAGLIFYCKNMFELWHAS